MEPKTARHDVPTTIDAESLERAARFRRAAADGSLVRESFGAEELQRFIEPERQKRSG
jgi:hypothetical protein